MEYFNIWVSSKKSSAWKNQKMLKSIQWQQPQIPKLAEIAAERMGVNGEYDQSGLAKRVALAFDEDTSVTDVETLWVAQTGGSVVLKGSVPSQEVLDRMVELASGVSGATDVSIDQVTVG
jgi:hypothetical protein